MVFLIMTTSDVITLVSTEVGFFFYLLPDTQCILARYLRRTLDRRLLALIEVNKGQDSVLSAAAEH